jgi:two-component system chemotaxis response regulator CheB
MDNQLNILIVDDSVVIRKILLKILATEASFNVIGQAEDGQEAIDILRSMQGKLDVHVVVMDIEMPKMDGYSALPEVKKLFPKCRVIIASTLTQRGAEASMKALSAGASDYIPKPSPDNEDGGATNFDTFSKDLVTKVRILGRAAQSSYNLAKPLASRPVNTEKDDEKITLLQNHIYKPQALAIGSSTGGPEALQNFFKALNSERLKHIPIFITQHMPAKFTTLLASNISKNTGFNCVEAAHDEIVIAGKVYLAPGDYHMKIIKHGANFVVKLNQEPQINYCRPSVDPMLNSLVDIYAGKLLFTMLTGMGNDGLLSAKNLAGKGGNVFAQDKESSVVWGMPGAVAKAGICSKVAPIAELAKDIMGRF